MARETVLEARDGRVAIVTMNRPERRNAFTSQLYREMHDAMRDALDDDGVGAVVVTGAGSAFSAGQDLGEMAHLSTTGDDSPHPFPRFLDLLMQYDKPIVAAVNGVGVGLGFTMLLHCDVVLVSTAARLRLPFVTLGVVPEAASSYLLAATVGWQAAAEILYTADWLDAERAVRLGIASRAYRPDELLPAALAAATRFAAQPLGSIRHTKRLLIATRIEQVRAARAREDDAFAERIGTPENVEALAAFLEKRPPDFAKLYRR